MEYDYELYDDLLFIGENLDKQSFQRFKFAKEKQDFNTGGQREVLHKQAKEARRQYPVLFEKQEGVCAICRGPETAVVNGAIRRLALDHNHKTGQIRELLCSSCNHALGCVKEDIEILENIIKYINKHKTLECKN